ncbi:hypothetical protein ACLOJK_039041 [Asimina triloba]
MLTWHHTIGHLDVAHVIIGPASPFNASALRNIERKSERSPRIVATTAALLLSASYFVFSRPSIQGEFSAPNLRRPFLTADGEKTLPFLLKSEIRSPWVRVSQDF